MFGYDDIGRKIKNWAKWVFIVQAIVYFIVGFVLMGKGNFLIISGLLVIVIGPIFAWISSWFMYGYGQLIENSDIIAQEHIRVNEKHERIVEKNKAREQKRNAEKEVQCREKAKLIISDPNVSDNEFVDIYCPNCKAELSYTKEQLQNEDVTCPMCYAHIFL